MVHGRSKAIDVPDCLRVFRFHRRDLVLFLYIERLIVYEMQLIDRQVSTDGSIGKLRPGKHFQKRTCEKKTAEDVDIAMMFPHSVLVETMASPVSPVENTPPTNRIRENTYAICNISYTRLCIAKITIRQTIRASLLT
jgi:hypothetical protein